MAFFTTKQVATILGIAYSQVRKLIEQGKIEATNMGVSGQRIWRVSDVAITDFIQKNKNNNNNNNEEK